MYDAAVEGQVLEKLAMTWGSNFVETYALCERTPRSLSTDEYHHVARLLHGYNVLASRYIRPFWICQHRRPERANTGYQLSCCPLALQDVVLHDMCNDILIVRRPRRVEFRVGDLVEGSIARREDLEIISFLIPFDIDCNVQSYPDRQTAAGR